MKLVRLFKLLHTFYFVFCSSILSHAYASPDLSSTLTVSKNDHQQTLTLEQMKSQLTTHEIIFYHPIYKDQRRYNAFKFVDVLKIYGGLPEGAKHIFFSSIDGYNTSLTTKAFKQHSNAWLAYEDLTSKDGNTFELFERQGKSFDPSPFYFLWKDPDTYHEIIKWPFAIKEIKLESIKDPYAVIAPKPNSTKKVKSGYKIFSDNCIFCHSINLTGGNIGPELNLPMNITEYRNDKFLRAWIRNPEPSFRTDIS
ncbi:hypothetical protein D5018_20715 [Parashewanella curva]|uniref:Cytochrome c domain-containing protein n=1 Tax=Parashewanella curva TaxID=2338552 RepID=A0A3L8PQX4_9GAMM|nr:c-type cytochrome [Parashewanella curva]RLV57780.1 hypothetical protein D5018_20715 [Parashewanella curva]